jgi:CBS domain-containing protein
MKARDLMTTRPYVVTPDDPVSHAAVIMRDHDLGCVPVVDDAAGMRLRGVITDRDIAVRCVAHEHTPHARVKDFMTLPPLDTVSTWTDVREVMEIMKEDRVRRVLVTDGDRLVGMIAQADLARREGPVAPLEVEKVLERISEPNVMVAHA